MNDVLAQITPDPKLRKVANPPIAPNGLRFKCTRCAALCCKLGGPALTKEDVEQIKDAGYHTKVFLESTNGNGSSALLFGEMKSREDGSCVFLDFDAELDCYKCGIYDFRPLLCRLYPFSFEIDDDSNRIALKFFPC